LDSGVPFALVAAVVTEALIWVLPGSAAAGVKVATVLSEFMLTDPATLPPLTVSLTEKATAGEVSVIGFMGSLKVALTVLGTTTLPASTVLTGTLVALSVGFEYGTLGPAAVVDPVVVLLAVAPGASVVTAPPTGVLAVEPVPPVV
jgi:hypothetical protein